MGHSHAHDQNHSHEHDHHDHDHTHNVGLIAMIGAALHLPGFGHDHDHGYTELAADSALHDNELGIRTVWLALLLLGITTLLQIAIVIASGSVALLADTVHNFGDALNSIPLLLAFYLARKAATQRYTYGFGRAEDVAGIFIVLSIGFSAGYILLESFQKLVNPEPLTHLPWVAAAAVIGFVGNEGVAMMQIRVGKKIGSDAMIADGQHALIDGLTSLMVLVAVFGTLIDVPILDPLVGIVIGVAIVGITWNAIKAVWYRLMDAVDPGIVEHIEHHTLDVEGVRQIETLRVRYVGHRLYAEMRVSVDQGLTLTESCGIVENLREELFRSISHLHEVTVQVQPGSSD